MKKPTRKQPQSTLGEEIIAGLKGFVETLEAGVPVESRYTVHTVTLDLEPHPYESKDLVQARHKLNASQALLAKFLGVSVKTLSAWEQGTRPLPLIAGRYLDDILAHPELFLSRIRATKNTVKSS